MKTYFKLSDRTYDFLKQVALYWLPAIGTFYFTLGSIWGLPYGEQVVGTVTALVLLLSVILGVSKSSYEPSADGTLVMDTQNPLVNSYSVEIPLEELQDKQTITLKVQDIRS